MWGNTAKLYLNMSLQHWTKVGSGKRPQPRHSHTACCIAVPLTGQEHSVLMVVGGWNGLKVFSDVLPSYEFIMYLQYTKYMEFLDNHQYLKK